MVQIMISAQLVLPFTPAKTCVRHNLQLIQLHTVLVFTLWCCLRDHTVILAEETSQKAAEHAHNAKLILRVCIVRARIEDDLIYAVVLPDPSTYLVATPQVVMHQDRLDPAAAAQVPIAK